MTLARGIFEDLSPPHRPPFSGGLSPIPMPPLSTEGRRVMAQLGTLEAMRSGTTLALEDTHSVDAYADAMVGTGMRFLFGERAQIGRASGRERVCQSVSISGVVVLLKKKQTNNTTINTKPT